MKKLFAVITLLLSATISFAQSKTIAVPAPKTVNIGEGNEWIPLFIQGVITTNFQQYSGMKVIDRQNADMVKAEQRLSEGAEYDEKNAIELGKLTSARLIITGSITGKSSNYALMFNITDAETGENKASATIPNCLFSALENGEAANQISYDLMLGFGISLDKNAKEKLTQKSKKKGDDEVVAQASLAKGIIAEQKGTNIEALTYYIQAKKSNANLNEATSRISNMSTVVSTGNFGADAKNMIQLRNEWDKLLKETAELIAANPPTFELRYFTDINPQEMTEENYKKQTMSLITLTPYIVQTSGVENRKIVSKLLYGLRKIPESRNWGAKIIGFPWTYANDVGGDNWLKKALKGKSETHTFTVSVLDGKKKEIAKKKITFTIEYNKTFFGYAIRHDNILHREHHYFTGGVDYESDYFIFNDVSVKDVDTDTLYISVKNKGNGGLSILPAPEGALLPTLAGRVVSSKKSKGDYENTSIKVVGSFYLGKPYYNRGFGYGFMDEYFCSGMAGIGDSDKVSVDLSDVTGLESWHAWSYARGGYNNRLDHIVEQEIERRLQEN